MQARNARYEPAVLCDSGNGGRHLFHLTQNTLKVVILDTNWLDFDVEEGYISILLVAHVHKGSIQWKDCLGCGHTRHLLTEWRYSLVSRRRPFWLSKKFSHQNKGLVITEATPPSYVKGSAL
eukprot:5218101-Amphidinium_carterae.1